MPRTDPRRIGCGGSSASDRGRPDRPACHVPRGAARGPEAPCRGRLGATRRTRRDSGRDTLGGPSARRRSACRRPPQPRIAARAPAIIKSHSPEGTIIPTVELSEGQRSRPIPAMTDREISMVQTGSMQKYTKGNLLLINDKPLNYAMSNIFEIGATWPKSYDRVVIGKNGPYVLACFRAEGEDKTWWYMPHDEYVVLVEGEMTIEYKEPRDEIAPGPHKTVTGTDMGSMVLRDGSLASLPAKNAYFTVIHYPGGEYHMPVGEFLRAVQRDIGWNFFYGMVKFDQVFGTFNFYDNGVDMFVGKYNDAWQKAGKAYSEMFPNERISATLKAILEDWVPPDFNPWAAPRETGSPFGRKRGGPHPAIFRKRIVTKTMIKEPRTDATHPVNEAFKGLQGKDGEMKIKPEFKERFGLLNLYDYLARNDVTWNPEIVSAVEYSLFCPTTEEYILPITHGNDRVEWFLLLNGQISMEIRDRDTGNLRAYMHMKPGDCCAMPADISHNLWAPERSMLLVCENGNPELPELIRLGKTPTTPLQEFGLS